MQDAHNEGACGVHVRREGEGDAAVDGDDDARGQGALQDLGAGLLQAHRLHPRRHAILQAANWYVCMACTFSHMQYREFLLLISFYPIAKLNH